MATVTVQSTTIPNYQAGGSTASIRIYATENFFGSGVEYVAGLGYFYKNVACTVAGTTVTVPTFTLESTTDSTNDSAKYIAILYDHLGTKTATLMNGLEFSVEPTNTTPTWTQLLIANQAVRRRLPDEYYTAQHTNLLIGDVNLSVAAEAAARAAADIVLDNEKQDKIEESLSDYASLDEAISEIGAADVGLVVHENITVSTNTTVPANIAFCIKGGAIVTVGVGATLTINNFCDPGNTQVFAGAGAVLFARGVVQAYNTAWRTGSASGGNVTVAINEGIANTVAWSGGNIQIPPGKWFTSGNHLLFSNTRIYGAMAGRNDGDSTSLELTAINMPLFKFGENVYNLFVSDMHLTGAGLTGTTGILGEGSVTASQNIRFTNLWIDLFDYGVRFNSTSGNWQVANVRFDKCYIIDCAIVGVRMNSSNMDSIEFDNTAFLCADTGAVWLENAYNVIFDGCQFNGNLIPMHGVRQVEQQQVVAAAGITVSGNAKVVVTWPGTLASPETILIPLTTAVHTTAALIATAIRTALEQNSNVHRQFFVLGEPYGVGDLVYIATLDGEANVVAANFTIENDTCAGITNSLTSTTHTTGVAPTADVPAVLIGQGPNNVTFVNCVEEGFGTFIEISGSRLTLIGNTIFEPIRSTTPFRTDITSSGNRLLPKIFRGDTVAVSSFGDSILNPHYVTSTLIADVKGSRLTQYGLPHQSTSFPDYETVFGRPTRVHESIDSLKTADDPLLTLTSPQANKTFMRMGYAESDDGVINGGYDIKRATNGFLKVASTLVHPFDGLELTGTMRSAQLERTRSITLANTGTIDIDGSYSDRYLISPVGNITLTMSNIVAGRTIFLSVITSGTTSYNITFGTGFAGITVLPTGVISGETYVLVFYTPDTVGAVEVSRNPITSLKLIDPNYSEYLGATTHLSVASSSFLTTSNHFVGIDFERNLTLSGTGRFVMGLRNAMEVGGSFDNSTIYGQYNFLHYNGTTGAGNDVYGVYSRVNVNDVADTFYAGYFTCTHDSAAAGGTNLLVGVAGVTLGGHNGSLVNAIAGDFLHDSNNNVATNVKLIRARYWGRAGGSSTDLRGISLAEWDNTGPATITTSYGIYANTSIDIGTTRWFIYSESTSPSLLSGDLQFANGVNVVVNTSTGTKIGTATSQKIGFFNATPVIQPAGTGETVGFTAGAGTAVLNDSTFTGNVGATAYRISDIVKALKNVGLLAQ